MNPQHMKIIRKGAKVWNQLREEKPFEPDLRNANISSHLNVSTNVKSTSPDFSLRGINLAGAKLEGATLANFDLSGADFTGANLNDAILMWSDFTDATFLGTELEGATFREAKLACVKFGRCCLKKAIFYEADLTGAEFWKCNLKKADFLLANLSNADFVLSRPWESYLYGPETDDDDTHAFKGGCVTSIDKLLGESRDFRERHKDGAVLYFRGESQYEAEWELRPAIMREPKEDQRALRLVEEEMLKDLSTHEPEALNQLSSALAEWVLAQHHRLPTRFLDVTRNPLVALYNACGDDCDKDGRLYVFGVQRSLIKSFDSDAVSVIANFAKLQRWEKNHLMGKRGSDSSNDLFHKLNSVRGTELMERVKIRLYDSIRQEKPYFERRIDIRDLFSVFVVEPQRTFERIRAQSGAFLVSAFHERFEREEVLRQSPRVPIYSFSDLRIPQENKGRILDDLRLLNITRETLYPSIDESAKAIKQRHLGRSEDFDDKLTPDY